MRNLFLTILLICVSTYAYAEVGKIDFDLNLNGAGCQHFRIKKASDLSEIDISHYSHLFEPVNDGDSDIVRQIKEVIILNGWTIDDINTIIQDIKNRDFILPD